MEVHAEWRFGTDVMDVWIIERAWQQPRQLVVKGAEEYEWVEIAPGSPKLSPSLSMPSEVWKALSAKVNGVLPPSEATERHLLDAIKVRDRLLDKVAPERSADGR